MSGLPMSHQRLLDGKHLPEAIGEVILLAASGADQWPHIAMLSAGEALAVDESELRLALHAGSGTCQGMRANGRGLLLLRSQGAAVRCRLRVDEHAEEQVEGLTLAGFRTTVTSASPDAVSYASLEGWVSYRLQGSPDNVISRWRAQIDWLSKVFV